MGVFADALAVAAAAVGVLDAVGVVNGAVVTDVGLGSVEGVSTVSSAWITPFVASRFLAWIDAELTFSPLRR